MPSLRFEMRRPEIFSEHRSSSLDVSHQEKDRVRRHVVFGSKDSRFTLHYGKKHAASHIGIPIGNLTSQFFANVYLNGLDHFIKERLSCECYLRYMDDFVLFHDDKDYLWQAKKKIVEYLGRLRLSLHEGKCRVYEADCGVPFLGLVVFPDCRRLKRPNIVRFKKRFKKFQNMHRNDPRAWPHIYRPIRSWIGHASHANTMQLRKLVLEEVVFQTGKGD